MWFLGVCIIPLIYIMWQSLYYFGPNGHNTIKTGEKLEFYFTGNIFQELQYPLIIMAFAIIMIAITVIKREMDVYYLISILMFIIARLEVLFVHGSAQGEMGWGFYIATFFVFLISIKNYIRFFWAEDSWCGSRILFDLSIVALFLHVITGGYYLIMYIWGDWLGY